MEKYYLLEDDGEDGHLADGRLRQSVRYGTRNAIVQSYLMKSVAMTRAGRQLHTQRALLKWGVLTISLARASKMTDTLSRPSS